MPQYKLMYFDARGRAEVIRMLFTLKGVEFEDCRMKREEWPAMKDNTEMFPLGQVPILIIDGKTMPHGKAINRYLARNLGYYGKTDEQTNVIELVSESVDDIIQKIYPIYYDKDEEKKAKNMQEFKDTVSVPQFKYLISLFTQTKGPFFCGDEITLADLIAFTIFDAIILTMRITDILDPYPELAAFYKRFNEDSPLSSYIKSRPVTFF
ncbi:S-crystallin SL11 [Strongylocentrotus purpuratus]|uniref:Glutathione transferase n=1 Tax=Strongylocentrotus purpuratus TaxID=7668 RepID=A0A7M7RHD3_STRPU|nr:S-crystallin SL11 [Strongylocentrotus purpuratus]